MVARVIDGRKLATDMKRELADEVAQFKAESGVTPGLAAVLVGDDPASQVYVSSKQKACGKVGMHSELHRLPGDTTEAELVGLVSQLNEKPDVHGILVQLPLPSHISEELIVDTVSPEKDVDGFGPRNLGLLAAGRPSFLPCTPAGIQEMLARYDIPIEGQHVVIVGRSNIVGKPLGLILVQKAKFANATVTLCHSRTRDIGCMTRSGDIVVVAIGKANFLTADMIRPGAAVVDVGINRIDGKLVGDVDYNAVSQVAGAISPVPGGVGPMTITMLLFNTLHAARLQTKGGS